MTVFKKKNETIKYRRRLFVREDNQSKNIYIYICIDQILFVNFLCLTINARISSFVQH
jgi:hypothetical protein